MARYETTVHGTIEELRSFINENSRSLGITLSVEDESEGEIDGVKYYFAGMERFAALGSNRVSLNIALLEYSQGVRVIATALGGSQALFIKVNFWSEENFLNAFISLLEEYER